MAGTGSHFLGHLFKKQLGRGRHDNTSFRNRSKEVAEAKAASSAVNKSAELSGQSRSTFLIAFSPDGRMIASTHGDHSVRITSVKTGRCLHTLTGHPRTPWCITFHPTSNDILASGCLGGEVRIWDLRGGGTEVWKSEKGYVISSISFHPIDQVLVIATTNEILFWDWTRPEPFARCRTSTEYERVRWVKFDALGQNLLTGIANGTTIQREEVSYINSPPESLDSDERHQLIERYRSIVDQISVYQHDRIRRQLPAAIRQSMREQVQPPAPSLGVEVSGPHEVDVDIVQPSSPVQLESLHNAYMYAARITREANQSLLSPDTDDSQSEPATQSLEQPLEGATSRPAADYNAMSLHSLAQQELNNNNLRGLHVRSNNLREEHQPITQRQRVEAQPISVENEPLLVDLETSLSSVVADDDNAEQVTSDYSPSSGLRLLAEASGAMATGSDVRMSGTGDTVNSAYGLGSLRGETDADESDDMETESTLQSMLSVHRSASSASSSASSQQSSATVSMVTPPASIIPPSGPSLLMTSNTFTPISGSSVSPVTNSDSESGQSHSSVSVPTRMSADIVPSYIIPNTLANTGGATGRSASGFVPLSETLPPPSHHSLLRFHLTASAGNSSIADAASNPARSNSGGSDAAASNPASSSASSSVGNNSAASNVVYIYPASRDADQSAMSVGRDNVPSSSNSHLSSHAHNNVNTSGGSISTEANLRVSSSSPAGGVVRERPWALHPVDLDGTNQCETGRCRACSGPFSQFPCSTSGHSAGHSGETGNTAASSVVESEGSRSEQRRSTSSSSGEIPSLAETCRHSRHWQRTADAALNRWKESLANYRAQLSSQSEAGPSNNNNNNSLQNGASTSSTGNPTVHRFSYNLTSDRNVSNQNSDSQFRSSQWGPPTTSSSSSEGLFVFGRNSGHNSQTPTTRISTHPRGYSDSDDDRRTSRASPYPHIRSNNPELRNSVNSNLQRQMTTLNQLDRRVSEIQQNLNERLRSLREERRNMSDMLHEEERTESSSAQQRLSDRLRWLREGRATETHQSRSARLRSLRGARHRRDPSEIRSQLSLNERLRALREERQMREASLYRRIGSTRMRPTQRMLEYRESLRNHLDDIRQRYMSRYSARDRESTPEMSDMTDRAESTITHAERELRGMREELSRIQSRAGQQQEWLARVQDRQRQLHNEIQTMREEMIRRRQQQRERDRTWHSLQRRHLHPHYAVSIMDDTINNHNDGLQAAINRAIAGAFMGNGEGAVASNIVDLTHRIQRWDFNQCRIPDITSTDTNVVVAHCKLHNDASCDISQDGSRLATFVPTHNGFPDDTVLAVFSLETNTLGQCLFTKSFGPNAISVSISPLNNYVLVGLAAKRLAWVFTPNQMVGQVFQLKAPLAGESSMQHVMDVMHPCEMDLRTHVSVNSARWIPGVGEGLVYGTNRGDLHICHPAGFAEAKCEEEAAEEDASSDQGSSTLRRNLFEMLGMNTPRTISIATQTVANNVRRSAATQTEQLNQLDSD